VDQEWGALQYRDSHFRRTSSWGAGHLWLGVWEHNHRAKAFYERWGFVPVGTETFLLGSDEQADVLMQLVLSDRA
jgi:ribosomal protein S18 acetylase RimI-like enzyme